MNADTERLVTRALTEAEDALERLRRGHGVEVSGICYPAMNTVREAVAALRSPPPPSHKMISPDDLASALWAELERQHRDNGTPYTFMSDGVDGHVDLQELAAAVEKVIAAPAGWKLVPIEPTSEQLAAGYVGVALTLGASTVPYSRIASDAYKAMVAAAPAPRK